MLNKEEFTNEAIAIANDINKFLRERGEKIHVGAMLSALHILLFSSIDSLVENIEEKKTMLMSISDMCKSKSMHYDETSGVLN